MDEQLIPDDDSFYVDDFLNIDASVGSNALVEDSFSSLPGLPEEGETPKFTSTPRRPQQPMVPRQDESQPFSAPRLPRTVPPAQRLPCPQCQRSFANERTLSVHVRMHTMKGSFESIYLYSLKALFFSDTVYLVPQDFHLVHLRQTCALWPRKLS